MAIAHVQSTKKDAGSVTSTTLAYPSNVTAGSTLLAVIRIGATGRTVTVSDGVNGSWTQDKTQAQTTDGYQTYIYRLSNAAAGATTVTVSISGAAATMRFSILEYSGIDTASPIDQSNAAQGASSGVVSSGDITTTVANCLLFGGSSHNNSTGSAWTAGTSGGTWTKRQEGGGLGSAQLAEDLIVSSTGTYRNNPTSAAANWTSLIVAYKQAGGAVKTIVPAGVAGSATVSSTVVETAALAPTVNGSAAVTGTVVEDAALAPAAVSGVATVTSTVAETAALAPASVTGTAAVAATLVETAAIVPAQVSGAATVAAGIVRTRPISPATINGAAAVSSSVVETAALAASVAGAATVAATLVETAAIAPDTVNGAASVAGTVTTTAAIPASPLAEPAWFPFFTP